MHAVIDDFIEINVNQLDLFISVHIKSDKNSDKIYIIGSMFKILYS